MSLRTGCVFVAVDETGGTSDSRLYQVPGMLQETGWESFTLRSEKDRSQNVFAVALRFVCMFRIFIRHIVCICLLSSVGTIFPMEVG